MRSVWLLVCYDYADVSASGLPSLFAVDFAIGDVVDAMLYRDRMMMAHCDLVRAGPDEPMISQGARFTVSQDTAKRLAASDEAQSIFASMEGKF